MGIFDKLYEKNLNNDKTGIFYYRKDIISKVSYSNLLVKSEKLASYLSSKGVKKGDKVGLHLKYSPEWIVFDLACLKIGAIVVAIHPGARKKELEYIVNDSKIKLVVSDKISRVRNVKNIVFDLNKLFEDNIKNYLLEEAHRINVVGDKDVALICYTSGSTGRPKGVILTHGNILFNIQNQPFLLNEASSVVSYLPITHMFERAIGYYNLIYHRSNIFIARDQKDLIASSKVFKPTHLLAVPIVIEKLYEKVMEKKISRILLNIGLGKIIGRKVKTQLGGRIRAIISGGSPLRKDLLKFITKTGIPVYQGYGLTEAGPLISTNYPGKNISGSVGIPLKGIESKIEDGELLVRSPGLFLNYTNYNSKEKYKNGWFKTGDLASIKNGFLFLNGRKDDLIILNTGKKVYPEHIEGLFESNGIQKALVHGNYEDYLIVILSSTLSKERIEKIVSKVNDNIPKYAKIKRFHLTKTEFTDKNGLLTRSFKKDRKKIVSFFSDEIKRMYED